MKDFAHTHALLALLRDGFHPQASGGRVELRADGSPVLDYPLTDYVFDGARRALLTMAQIQFEAGAKAVYPVHELAGGYRNWPEARAAIGALPMKPLLLRVVSAHVMGGCAIAGDEQRGVARPAVSTGSWPTCRYTTARSSRRRSGPIAALDHGITARLASGLATRLTGRAAPASPSGG